MQLSNAGLAALKSKYAVAATLLLVAQGAGFFLIQRQENVAPVRPFSEFPQKLADWEMLQQGVIEKEIQDVLQADDILTRVYYSPSTNRGASLFVAYFKSQRTGQRPHSPKNCLPGSGWSPMTSGTVQIPVPGGRAIEVNQYVVSKGEDRSLVLYWYQSRNRVIADEYKARMYTIADALRYNRTETALVRVVVPVMGDGVDAAAKTAAEFVAAFFDPLRGYLPS